MKKDEKKEQLSRELLKVLRSDEAYRSFSATQEFQKQVGEEIGKLRKKKKMSTKEFGEKIGKKESDVSKMERGEYKQYTLKLLLKIADVIGVSMKVEYL